jgi:hypothetical protein
MTTVLPMLEIFALLVLLVLVGAAIAIVVILGNIPGNMARAANHPQAEAISILGWLGLLTGGVGWLLAIVWAKFKPSGDAAALEQRVKQLEERLQQMEANA